MPTWQRDDRVCAVLCWQVEQGAVRAKSSLARFYADPAYAVCAVPVRQPIPSCGAGIYPFIAYQNAVDVLHLQDRRGHGAPHSPRRS